MPDNTTGIADVVVLGAGIVGVSAAIAARQRGHSVALVDRREPGSETSYGNAGVLSSGSIFPLNVPALWDALPKYLTNRHPALRWDLAWSILNAAWVALSFQCNAGARQAAGDGAAQPDRRFAEAASGMDRASRRR